MWLAYMSQNMGSEFIKAAVGLTVTAIVYVLYVVEIG
jgi:hypothetical protein